MKIYKFYADWCNPCKVLKEQLLNFEYDIIDIDVDSEDFNEKYSKFNIRKLPTVIITDDNDNILKRIVSDNILKVTPELIKKEYIKIEEDGNI